MSRYSSSQKGLTLLEMLVVLVITSLIATLLIQGTGFFLNSYQRVIARQDDYARQSMALAWYRESISTLVASQDEPFVFIGKQDGFQGFTFQPVLGASGKLTKQQWSLKKNGQYFELWLVEGQQQALLISRWLTSSASLSYRGEPSKWHQQWPVEGLPLGALPLRIKITMNLLGSNESREIYASIPVRRAPRLDYRDNI